MADIFKEVDEEVRQEQYKKLWDKYGSVVIGAAVALVLAVGGYQGWKAWDQNQRQEQSERYAAAVALIEDGQETAAMGALAAFGGPGEGGYAVLASLREAQLKVRVGDVEGAVAIWDSVAADSSLGAAFQGVATLLSTMHQIDDGDPGILEARLEPLTEPGNAFRLLALELSGLLALRGGDEAKARERFTAITEDAVAGGGVRTRASQLLSVLGTGE